MKDMNKLQRYFMVLSLTISFSSISIGQIIAAPQDSAQPAPSAKEGVIAKDKALKEEIKAAEAKAAEVKAVETKASDTKAAPKEEAKVTEVKTASKEDVKAAEPTKFDISKGFSSVAEKAITAVVNVSTTQIIEGGRGGRDGMPQFPPGSPFEDFFKEFFDQMERPRKVQSLGSGFIIQSDETSALIVTNYHVIADAKKVTVFLNDNTELDATVHAFDVRTDLALLKVKTDSLPVGKGKLPPLEWGDSHTVKVGDWILAIGNPFGLGSTVTSGIISNRARDIMLRSGGRNRINDYVDDFMQHDAAINMGNSGGPLLNLQGKVVGIFTAIFSPSGGHIGIGFAIPSAVAQDTVTQLLKFGRTKRGWLGVRIQAVTDDIAESLGLGKARGAIVGSVTPGGPAAKAKPVPIEPEDIILELDGKPVNEKSRLARIVGETPVNKEVKIKILRQGKEQTVSVVLGEFETAPEHAAVATTTKKATVGKEVKSLGMSLSELTPELKDRFNKMLPKDAKGIMVMKVEPNSPADEIGIKGIERGGDRPGDIIEKVNQKELSKPEEFVKAVEEAKKENRRNILLLVTRNGEPRFVPLKLESDDIKEPAKP